jgi:hypothetical protein
MRNWVTNYMNCTIKVTRDVDDPDDWVVDEDTGELTRSDVVDVYEGPATIAANEQRYSESSVDRLFVRLPGEVEGIHRSDILEVLQAPDDLTMLLSGRWLVLDVDMGAHHVTRRLECVNRLRNVQLKPSVALEGR